MPRKPPTEPEAPVDFEQSLQELESLVERLERGDLPLADALAGFERGVALTRQCQTALSAAQQRVEVLLRENGGSQARPFDADAADDADGDAADA